MALAELELGGGDVEEEVVVVVDGFGSGLGHEWWGRSWRPDMWLGLFGLSG